MNIKSKSLFRLILTTTILITSLASSFGTGYSQDALAITVEPFVDCGDVQFQITLTGGYLPYQGSLVFGDGDTAEINTSDAILEISHTYPDQGLYEWTVQVGGTSESGLITLVGPEVTLSSNPFPPLFVVGDPGLVEFSTKVIGGTPDIKYSWDLDGDGTFDGETGETATHAYTDPGKYYSQVLVTDGCGFTSTDSLPVVVADPDNICHPTAQKIADGVNSIFPDQSNDLYTCDDVYSIFDNESDENNLGFGRMWKAYNLAESMEELSWEDILDWHLNEGGWGALLQLDRFADLLEEHDLPELMGLVMSDEFSLGDVRTAVRSVTRYEADFDDALTRITDGAKPGEMGQFYKLVNELEADPTELDTYLADGLTLSELKHSAKFADKQEVDWTEIADARASADSWGDINQAYRLATDEVSAAEILIIGIKEYKEDLQGDKKADKEEKQANKNEEKNKNTAEKLAQKFSAEFGDVMNLYNGECEGDWACVRNNLREQVQTQSEGYTEKDHKTALQIASKYGFSEEEVLTYNHEYCNGDWACTRAYFRDQAMSSKETGKSKNK